MTQQELMSIVDALGPGFAENAARNDSEDTFVAENFEQLRKRRVFSAMVPADLGGGGVSHRAMCGFLRKLATHCSSTALSMSMHQHLVAAQVFNHTHGKPGRATLEKVAAKELGLISTGARDWLESNGTVEKVKEGFRVSATKAFASGSPSGHVLVTSAPYDDPKEGPQVLHFPVPFSAEGVRVENDWRAMGMRGTGSNTVVLDKVLVPEESVVLRRPRGYHGVWNVVLTVAMPLISSVYVGVAEAAADIARATASKRTFDDTVPYWVGEMENALTTAQLAVDSMVELANDFDFQPTKTLASAVLTRKTIAINAALATCEKALSAAGGGGYFRRLGLERLVRDAHAGQFHPLQEKAQHLFTGRLALGWDAAA